MREPLTEREECERIRSKLMKPHNRGLNTGPTPFNECDPKAMQRYLEGDLWRLGTLLQRHEDEWVYFDENGLFLARGAQTLSLLGLAPSVEPVEGRWSAVDKTLRISDPRRGVAETEHSLGWVDGKIRIEINGARFMSDFGRLALPDEITEWLAGE